MLLLLLLLLLLNAIEMTTIYQLLSFLVECQQVKVCLLIGDPTNYRGILYPVRKSVFRTSEATLR